MLKYIKETLKNSFIYSIGNAFVKLSGFILIPFLTNPEYLSIDNYGALGVLEAVNQIAITVMGFGLYNSLIRWYYDQNEHENKATFFTSSLIIGFLILVICSITYLFKSEASILLFNTMIYQDIIVLVMLSTGLQALGVLPATLMRMQEKALFYTITNIIKLVTTLLVTLILLFSSENGLFAIYIGQIVGFITYLIILFPFMLQNSTFRIHFPVFTEMMGYGFSMMMSAIAVASTNVIDRFVLNTMSGLQEVALYSLGFKISSVIKVFIITSVSMSLTPIIFKKMKDDDSHRFYQKSMTYYGFGIMICIMIVSLFGKEVLKLIAVNASYWSSFTVIPLLAFGLFFVALNDIVTIGIRIKKKTSRITLMTFIVSTLNLSLNVLLIPIFNAEGAALASLLSQIFFFSGLYYFSNKMYPISFEWRKVFLIFTVGAILVSLSLLSHSMNLPIRLTIKASAILLFPIILYYFNFYEKAELEQLKYLRAHWRNPAKWKNNIHRILKDS